jgi:hypothetical protein
VFRSIAFNVPSGTPLADAHNGLSADFERHELTVAAKGAERLDGRLARVWRAIGQQRFGQELPRERRGPRHDRLRAGRAFAVDHALWKSALFDREQRRAVGAIEQKDEPLLACLRDRVYAPAVPHHRDQARRRRRIVVPDIVMERNGGHGRQEHERVARYACVAVHVVGPLPCRCRAEPGCRPHSAYVIGCRQ